MVNPEFLSFVYKKNDISLVVLLLTLVFFVVGLTALIYPCLILISIIWVRAMRRKEAILFLCFVSVLAIIGVINLAVIGNYLDLTWKAIYKLFLFAISAIAYRNFFFSIAQQKLSKLRLTIWLSFLASLFAIEGFDLQSMPQMMIINILFMVELYAFVRGDTRFLFLLATFILLITTKKQLWFSAFILIFFIQPALLKKYLMLLIMALLFVSVFGVVGADKGGVTTEKRLSGSLDAEKFITPDPYGNMRLYMARTLIPKLIEHDILFGYGLERFGTTAAYESNRDVERGELGLDDFVGKDYNPDTLFGSVAADSGILTIMMQAGMAGLVLYFLMLWTLAHEIKILLKGLLVILPYFFGGPVVYSVGLPILLGMTYALFALQRALDGSRELRFLAIRSAAATEILAAKN